MRDIKKHSQNSKSRVALSRGVPIIHSHQESERDNDIYRKVEEFEGGDYDAITERRANRIRELEEIRRNRVGEPTRGSKISKKFFAILGGLAVFLILFSLITYVFNNATINVILKSYDIKAKDNLLFINSTNTTSYNLVEITKTLEKDIPKSETKKVVSKASGKIVIYNNYSESNQKLVKNTRFESPEGKIFRISETVVVPGKTNEGPGKIEVKVTADSTGDSYNIKPVKFTIPGFKNSPRYQGFYAESSVNMVGGADGMMAVIKPEDVEKVDTEAREELKTLIKKEASTLKKEGYLRAGDEIVFSFSNNLVNFEKEIDSKYKVSATAYIALVNVNDLTRLLASALVPSYKGEDVRLDTVDSLRLRVLNTNLANATSLVLYVEGMNKIIYNLDADGLRNALAGKSNAQSNFNQILSSWGAIKEANIKVFPVWSVSYPVNAKKINITESVN